MSPRKVKPLLTKRSVRLLTPVRSLTQKNKLPPKDGKDLTFYNKYLYTKTIPFPCPHCSCSVLPKDYEKHCKELHEMNTLKCCAWCSGNATWDARCKCENIDHLYQCCRKFLILHAPPLLSTPSTFDRSPLCPEKDFFDCTPSTQSRAYDHVWSMPLAPTLPVFDLDSLNRAASCVRMYLDLGQEVEWHHIIVRSVAYPSFLEAMDADGGRTRTLSFSCWCDGGKYKEARYRQHRHMITISPPHGHFERNVWKNIKISPEDRPGRHFRIRHKRPIESALHLVRTLGYLSQRESTCEFSGDRTSPPTPNHFYCFESLPKDFQLPLVMQWEGGLTALLDSTFKNMKWGDLVRADPFLLNRRWRFEIQNIPGIRFGLVLPVLEEFVPCPQPTDVFLHLQGGRKLYFKYRRICYSKLQTQIKEQADMTFYEVVGRNHWTPRPFHQRLLHEFRPLVVRIRELTSESAQLSHALENERQTRQQEKVRWEAQHDQDMTRLRQDHAQDTAKLLDGSQFEILRWREKYEVSEQEIKTLLKKIIDMNAGEIAQLKRQNGLLEKELERWKKKCAELEHKNKALEREATRPCISFHVARNQGQNPEEHRKSWTPRFF